MASSPRIQKLNVGVQNISRWRIEDEQHLPRDTRRAPTFLPQQRPLDEILKKPSLDERLPSLLEPRNVDPELLKPAVMSKVREELLDHFSDRAEATSGDEELVYSLAARILREDVALDGEIRSALAELLKA